MLTLKDLLSDLSEAELHILEHRAQVLSHRLLEEDTEERATLLTAQLGGELYAISVEDVREIRPLIRYTRVPSAPPFVLGVLNLRGMILSLIDLRRFLGIPSPNSTFKSVVVVKTGGVELGLAVEQVGEVLEVPLSDFNLNLLSHSAVDETYIRGVSSEGVVWLNTPAILSDPKLIVKQDIFQS